MSSRILTPTGYRDIADCVVGDEVLAFDLVTGVPIVNMIETLQWVDIVEWERWWQVEPEVPPFAFYRINDTWTLNSEQSIWRNGTEVCHVKHLVVGDIIYDDTDQDVIITSIEQVTVAGWWRFDISGDHSYIADGLTFHNASRFWVSGVGTWDAVTTTHWSATTGGAGGVSVPGSADTVTLDGSSGGGTVTVNFGGTITVQSITSGAFTGTLDFSTNNNSVTLSAAIGFNGSGSGTRTINLGNGTWTISTATSSTPWNLGTVTGLTFNANSSTIVLSGVTASKRTFSGGGKAYNIVTFNANASGGSITIVGANTFATLNISGLNCVCFPSGFTTTITNAFAWSGSSGSEIAILSDSISAGLLATISTATGSATATWAGISGITFTGGATFAATSSFDLGGNSGITITAPSTSGGGGGMIIGA